MKIYFCLFGLFLALLFVSCSPNEQAYTPAFNPAHHKGPKIGAQNQVLVLGTPHLSSLPDTLEESQISPLIDRLAIWQPQIIMIENLSGMQCEFMRQFPNRYRDSVEAYCWDPAPARTATGLSVAQAITEAEELLSHWPENPTAGERRHLAALFMTSADRASALVQWLRLPESERHTGNGLNDMLVAELNTLLDRQNEVDQIAAPLAARLGIERLYPIDDHTADTVVADEEAYEAAITKAWDNSATHKLEAMDKAMYEKLGFADGLLNIYRTLNAPDYAPLVFRSDFGAALEDPSAQGFGRGYVGYWETRNLRMAANIRDIIGVNSGSRILVIVGASHKAYLEAYLNQMHDVRIVDAKKVLR